jgi:hypothetical protein
MSVENGAPRDVRFGLLLAILIVAFNAAWVSAHLGVAHRVRDVLETDHRHYIHMALEPREPEEPPYAFRVATPALARALMRAGLSVNASFYAITQVSLVAFLTFTFLFLRASGFDRALASLALAWMGLTQGAVRWFEYQYWMSDPPCLALVAAALYFIESGRWPVGIVLGLVAGSVRESYVLVLPFLFGHAWRTAGPRAALLRASTVAAAFLGVAAWWRSRIAAASVDDWMAGIVDSLGFRYRHAIEQQWYVLTIGTWAVFFALALFDPRAFARRARDRWDLTLMVLATYGSLIISNNTERPLAYAWPAVAAAACAGLRSLRTATSDTVFRAFVVSGTFVQIAHFVETRWYQLMGSSLYQPANAALTLFVVAIGIAGGFAVRRGGAR